MSSPPGTPRPKKRLRQLLTEPFKRSRSRSQSGSPSHGSQPLPQQGSGVSSTDGGSGQGSRIFTSSNIGTTTGENAMPSTSVTHSSHASVGAASDVPIIVEPSDDGSGVMQPTLMREASPHNDTLADIITLAPTLTALETVASISGPTEDIDTTSHSTLVSPEIGRVPNQAADGSETPADTTALSQNQKHRNVAWNRLRGSLQMLGNISNAFPPLGAAIESIFLCLDGLEVAMQNRHDFEDLATELTVLSDLLKQHVSGSSSALLSDSATSVAMAIERQAAEIQDRLSHAPEGAIQRASLDEEALVRHYRQIQSQFRLLQMNASMDTWRIVDEHLAITRLDSLSPAKVAAYDSSLSGVVGRRACTEGTRTKVLTGLDDWLYDTASSSIYWMDGMAGTGKTTIASTFCERTDSERRKLLAASFFCTRSSAECRDVTRILPTISYQLAQYSLPFRSELCQILAQSPDIGSKNLQKQFERLLIEPMKKVKDAMPNHVVVVIDALDECEHREGVEMILDLLLRHALDLPLKFLVTSRPEPEIYDKLIDSSSRQVIHLHNIEKSLVQADIELYLTKELTSMSPSLSDIEELAQRSGALFIYAATLVRYIRSGKRLADPRKRLRSVLSMTPEATKTHTQIDALYTAVLKSALSDDEMEADEVEDIRTVLRTVLCAQEPIRVETIAALAGIDDLERVVYALHPLRSVIHQSEETGLVSTLHASFADFMFDIERSGLYFCDIVEQSRLIAQTCFVMMKEQLRFNVCDLATSFLPDEQVENLQERVKERISPTLAYVCRYWADHLGSGHRLSTLEEMLEEFLCDRLLFWMEVLGLRREMDAGLEAFLKARQWLTSTGDVSSDIVLLVEDAYNFLTSYAASPASQSTPHIYISSLALCPKSNLVYKHYWKRMQGLLKLDGSLIQNRETAPLAIWAVDSTIWSIAYSPDGSRVATGDSTGEVVVRNAYDGTIVLGPLLGHTDTVRSVAFSPNGKFIASASYDDTIRMWNAYNGTPIGQPFRGHTNMVMSISFSPDSTSIVSGSYDHTIRVWNAYNGTLLHGPLVGHTGSLRSVVFSPHGRLIASASDDKTVRLWNSNDGSPAVVPVILHDLHVYSVAFTPDSTRVVSASLDGAVRVWNVHDGSLASGPFEGHKSAIQSAIVSPDGTRVASGSNDCTIRVWKIDDGSLISGPFVGHTETVFSIAYSPDGSRLMSGSGDKTIRVWNVRDNTFTAPPFPPPKSVQNIKSLAFSSDGTHFASSHEGRTIRIWDASDGSFTTGPIRADSFPSPISTISPDNSSFAALSEGFEVQIISTANGSVIAGPFGIQRNLVSTFQFSHSSDAVIMGCTDGTIKIATVPNQQQIPVASFTAHSGQVESVAESSDCSLIVSYSDGDNALRVWSVLAPALELPGCINSTKDSGSKPGLEYSVLSEGWRIRRDGWVVNGGEQLLFWIPADLASAWWSPYAMLVITEAGILQVPKQKPVIGDEWAKCYVPRGL
ncbi:unnamed protein product [Rhizoctonia solani]|uniref:NACHT domain-containing protein n=1 Tax=Rhizoctonia solani TaxID=456999 RepID=A0A8H3HFX4_9AGAM|nr:unnamed protein product [Rhizoctonia solani]